MRSAFGNIDLSIEAKVCVLFTYILIENLESLSFVALGGGYVLCCCCSFGFAIVVVVVGGGFFFRFFFTFGVSEFKSHRR